MCEEYESLVNSVWKKTNVFVEILNTSLCQKLFINILGGVESVLLLLLVKVMDGEYTTVFGRLKSVHKDLNTNPN